MSKANEFILTVWQFLQSHAVVAHSEKEEFLKYRKQQESESKSVDGFSVVDLFPPQELSCYAVQKYPDMSGYLNCELHSVSDYTFNTKLTW